jgi:hypothetical protein
LEQSQATIADRHLEGKTALLPERVRREATAIKRAAQIYAGERPSIFFAVHRLKRDPLAVQPTTQLVIEGFPRSANTFSVWAFREAQREEVRLAHHLHYPAQVVRAAQWQIPILLLIREPKDAITSLLMRRPLLPLEQALRHYISFYGIAARHRDAFVLGSFEEVVEDYGAVIERINDRFATEFSLFDHTEENVKKVYSRIEERHKAQHREEISETRVARPSATKEELKRKMNLTLEAPKHKKFLAQATIVYDHLIASSTTGPRR